jgi:histidinol-phosphate aminotransferase
LAKDVEAFSFVKKIYESDANFLLIKVADAGSLYQYLLSRKIIVRNRDKEVGCENCIRITIGTPKENIELLEALKKYNL